MAKAAGGDRKEQAPAELEKLAEQVRGTAEAEAKRPPRRGAPEVSGGSDDQDHAAATHELRRSEHSSARPNARRPSNAGNDGP